MFLVAIARPRFDEDGDVLFDRKIGLCPFIEWVAAKTSSKNRPNGELEMKPRTAKYNKRRKEHNRRNGTPIKDIVCNEEAYTQAVGTVELANE